MEKRKAERERERAREVSAFPFVELKFNAFSDFTTYEIERHI